MSPWGFFLAYQICAFHRRSGRESLASCDVVKYLKETFFTLDIRWNVAGKSSTSLFLHFLTKVVGIYLQLLEAQEVVLMNEVHARNDAMSQERYAVNGSSGQ